MSVKEKEHKDFFLPGKIFRDDKSWDQIGTNLAVLAVSSSILKEELLELCQHGWGLLCPQL